jgi:L-cysteine desulfidase
MRNISFERRSAMFGIIAAAMGIAAAIVYIV